MSTSAGASTTGESTGASLPPESFTLESAGESAAPLSLAPESTAPESYGGGAASPPTLVVGSWHTLVVAWVRSGGQHRAVFCGGFRDVPGVQTSPSWQSSFPPLSALVSQRSPSPLLEQ